MCEITLFLWAGLWSLSGISAADEFWNAVRKRLSAVLKRPRRMGPPPSCWNETRMGWAWLELWNVGAWTAVTRGLRQPKNPWFLFPLIGLRHFDDETSSSSPRSSHVCDSPLAFPCTLGDLSVSSDVAKKPPVRPSLPPRACHPVRPARCEFIRLCGRLGGFWARARRSPHFHSRSNSLV